MSKLKFKFILLIVLMSYSAMGKNNMTADSKSNEDQKNL